MHVTLRNIFLAPSLVPYFYLLQHKITLLKRVYKNTFMLFPHTHRYTIYSTLYVHFNVRLNIHITYIEKKKKVQIKNSIKKIFFILNLNLFWECGTIKEKKEIIYK